MTDPNTLNLLVDTPVVDVELLGQVLCAFVDAGLVGVVMLDDEIVTIKVRRREGVNQTETRTIRG